MVRDLRAVFASTEGGTLTSRQYTEHGKYPTSVIKSRFGSWSTACYVSGIACGSKHGTACFGPKNERLDSRHELAIAEYLTKREISYVPHPKIDDTDWVGDFYLPELRLWVEVDGYSENGRPNSRSFSKKLTYYEQSDKSLVVVADVDEFRTVIQEYRCRDNGSAPDSAD
ncbi:homing endonuclease associated repeat-containing protein [Haloprofundus halophilus]|uniref:homing endonuclease associated repeat-containing protein n=1 Tax=Haloprofundus halophilus TaxID=2283527 RepID=UPI003742CCD7